MADTRPITRCRAEEPAYFRPSPASGHFSCFGGALGTAIEAERDIEYGLWSDPAFDQWLSAAEAAWQSATDLCRAPFEAPATRSSDVPLQRFASHIHWTLGCEALAELSTACQTVVGHPQLFSWSGHGPEGRRISGFFARSSPTVIISDMTVLLFGSSQTHLGTQMPSGGGHIINSIPKPPWLSLSVRPKLGPVQWLCRLGA